MPGMDEGEPTLLRERVGIGESLGAVAFVFAFATALISPVAVIDLHAVVFSSQYDTLDDVVAWWPLYVVIYAPASVGAALLALGIFSVLRLRGAGSVRALSLTYGFSLLVGFAIVGAIVGIVARDWTIVITCMIVAVGMSAIGAAAALTRAYRVQVESKG